MGIFQRVRKQFLQYNRKIFPEFSEICAFVQQQNLGNNPGKKNWELRRTDGVDPRNDGERALEHAITRVCGDGWFNQCPTSAGLFSSDVNRNSNLDLIRRQASDKHEFIELKLRNPKGEKDGYLYASLELLTYAAVYDRCRRKLTNIIGNQASELMKTKAITLGVLAPREYFEKPDGAEKFYGKVNVGVKAYYAAAPLDGLDSVDFHFEILNATTAELQKLSKEYASNQELSLAGSIKLKEIIADRKEV